MTEKRKTGRPPLKPTPKQRRTVEELRSCGESADSIARALRIDVETLRKHFADELAHGHSRRRLEVVGMLFKSARGGNVSAQKHLEHMTAAAGAEAGFIAPEDAPAKVAKLGKKEQAQEAASTAGTGTEWGNDLAGP